jgi:hypothetical protein
MDSRYQSYIKERWVSNLGGKCAEATIDMVAKFPELKRVRGHYYCPFWGERQHWWCIAPDGTIVDPTVSQFPSLGSGKYVEWSEGEEEPVGRCVNCSKEVLMSKNSNVGPEFCSMSCADSYIKYLNTPLRH